MQNGNGRMSKMIIRVPIRVEGNNRVFDVEVLVKGDSFRIKNIRVKYNKKEKREVIIPFEEINRQIKACIAA